VASRKIDLRLSLPKLQHLPKPEKRKKADRKKNYQTDGKSLKNTDKVC
jgi:hypothetical protein